MTQDASTVRVALRGDAQRLLACRDNEVVIAGPAGTGKSYAALWKIHLMAMQNPGSRYLIARKTHKSLTSTGLVTFREQVAAEAIRAGVLKWYGGSAEKPAQYTYTNGSVIVVGGLDQPDKIMSSEYDAVFVQEATECTPDDWEKITTRLRNGKVSFQQVIADCNPQQPTHWLKKRADEGKMTMLYGRHTDNPRLYDERGQVTPFGETYLGRLDALTGVRKERLRWGRWAAAEGLIYGEWNPAVHLTDRKVLPREWRRVWAVDFGFTNPFVWQMWAVDDDGRLWLEKEIYHTQRLVEDHAKQILDTVTITAEKSPNKGQWKYPRPSAIICDHDAEDRATLERHLGIGTKAAWKGVSDGIEAVQARLRVQPDGKPRLFVCRDSLVEVDQDLKEAGKPTCFVDEIEGYVREPQSGGRPKGEPEKPLKVNDHSMDATRYVVAHLDLAPRPRVRWLG